MLKRAWLWFVPMIVMLFSGCGPAAVTTNVKTGGPTVEQAVKYQGPKARIAVASFKCKAAKCYGQIGDGVSDMLSTALFQSGRFIVLERGEGLRAIQEELRLGQSGYVNPNQAPQAGLMEGADILVIGAITAFEPEASGIGGGGLVIPTKVPLLGGVHLGKKDAYIAADIRLVDVRTGRVINATTVEGKASSWKVGGLGGTMVGSVALGAGLSAYKNTPMEKAVRVMIENAVNAISKLVPENYYRYKASGQPVKPLPPVSSTSTTSGGIVGGQAAYGGIVGGREQFVPGNRVLFAEDFSKYRAGDIPRSLRIVRGQVEVAQFSGKQWLRALSRDVVVTKKINLPKNFAVECEVYIPSDHGGRIEIYLGSDHSPDVLSWEPIWGEIRGHYAYWSNERLSKVKIERLKIHHFVIQQKNGMIKVFIDGVRAYQAPISGGIIGRRLPNRDAITLKLTGANPSEHKEVLVTNIKVTEYTK